MRFIWSVFAVLLLCQPALAVKSANQHTDDQEPVAGTGGRLGVKNLNDPDQEPVVGTGGKVVTYAYRLTDVDKETLARVEKYLTQVQTISSEFIQSSPNGDVSSGKFFLQRPGKLRMEYLPPMPVLMVTSGDQIIYYDKELDQITRIPLESALVGFLARNDVKFDNTVSVTQIERGEKTLSISLVQAKRPKDGSLTINFSAEPLALRNMIVRDSAGQVTTVSLNNSRFNFPLPAGLFEFKDPHLGVKAGIKK